MGITYARVAAGEVWLNVVGAAAEHGLAALAGSSPDVGVVGYTLGGGLSWLARKYGLAANSVTAVELVTAGGELVRADRENEPDLFWAVRGGGGSFGVVTAIEMELFPISEVFGGMMLFPIERASEVVATWRAWTDGVSEDVTSCARLLWLPPTEQRAGDILLIDSTHFTTLFGGTDSLANLWRNLALMT